MPAAQATGRQVIGGPLNTNVFAYDEKTRKEVLVNIAMASVPRVGDFVQDGQQKRYEVRRVVWIPLGHKAELDIREVGSDHAGHV